MRNHLRTARINVRLLITLAILGILVLGGGAVAYKVRKHVMANRALEAGREALEQRNWQEACVQLRIYLSKFPSDQEVLLQYADASLSIRPSTLQTRGAALVAYRRFLRDNPGHPEIAVRAARLYLIPPANPSDAAHVCRRRLDVAPDDWEAMLLLGKALAMLNNTDEAREVLTNLVNKHPEETKAYIFLSQLAARPGGHDAIEQARVWMDKSVKATPKSAEAYVHRAKFRRDQLKDWDGARADLESADSLATDDPEVVMWIANEWMMHGELDLAAKRLKALDDLDPDKLEPGKLDPADLEAARFGMEARLALQSQARMEGAELADRALAALVEDRRQAFLPLAVRLYLAADETGKASKCLTEYEDVVSKRTAYGASAPGSADPVPMLKALLATAQGRPYDAINELEALLERMESEDRGWGPDAILPRRVLANAYAATGQQLRAIGAWRNYLRLAPDDVQTATRLADALLTTDPAGAVQFACELETREPDALMPKLIRIQGELYLAKEQPTSQERLTELSDELDLLQNRHPGNTALAKLRIQIARLKGEEPILDDPANRVVAELSKEMESGPNPEQAAMKLARHFAGLERWSEAIQVCKRAIELAPESVDGYVFLAKLLYSSGNKQQAEQAYMDALEKFQGRLQMSVKASYAEFLLTSGDLEGGLAMVRELIQDHNDPTMVEGLDASRLATGQAMLAELIMRHGARGEGIGILEELRRQYPTHVGIRSSLLKAREILTDVDNAQSIVDEIRGIEGQRGLEWRIAQARVWLQSSSWAEHAAEIENLLEATVRVTPELTRPVLVLGTLYERMGDDEKAIETYRRSIEANAGDFLVASRLLDALYRLRRYDEAEGILKNLVAFEDELAEYRTNLTMGRGDYNAAVKQLEERIASNPEDASARVLLARLSYGFLNKAEKALRLLDEADQIHPGMQSALVVRIAILRAEGRQEDAVAMLNRLVEEKGDFDAYLNRARYYADEKQNDLAEQDLLHITTFPGEHAKACELLARFYRSVGRMDDALDFCRKGIEGASENRLLRILESEILLAMDNAERNQEGRAALAALLNDFPEDPEIVMRQAVALLAEKSPESLSRAEELLEQVIKVQPRNATAHLLLIEQAQITGQKKREEFLLDRAVNANGTDTRVLMAKATHAHLAGNIQEAERYAKRTVEIDPNHVIANDYLAEIRMAEGDLDGATRYNDQSLRVAPNNETSQVIHAKLLAARNRFSDAVGSLRKYVQTDTGKSADRAWSTLGLLLIDQGDLDSAEEATARAEELDPDTEYVLEVRLRLLHARGDFGALKQRIESYLLGDHEVSANLLVHVARMLTSAGEQEYFEYATRLLKHAADMEPDNVEATLFHAMVLHHLGKVEECAKQYRKVLELEPRNLQTLNDLAWILNEDLKQPEQALELADRGVAEYPRDPHLLDTRAVILEGVGRLEEARADLEKCLETDAKPSTRAQALFHLGRVLNKLGQTQKARTHFDMALELDKQYKCLSESDRQEIRSLLEL